MDQAAARGALGARPCSAAPSFAYVPALDGMRAVSVGLVMVSHFGLGAIVPGGLGVTVFFFISGFLITRQLLAERAGSGRIAIGAFYVRRALRLYPALLTMVAIGGGAFALLGGTITIGQLLASLFYYNNYFFLLEGYRTGLADTFHPYAILWSLAVEEHYYLLFPLTVALFAGNRRGFAAGLCAAIVAVALWRWHVAAACHTDTLACLGGNPEDRVVRATDTRVDSILFGAVLATALDTAGAPRLLRVLRDPRAFAVGCGLLLASLAIRAPMFRDSIRFSVQGVALLLAVGGVLFAEPLAALRGLLSLRPAVLMGRWSYSLYLWHWIVLVCASALLPQTVGQPVTSGVFGRAWFAEVAPVLLLLSFAAAALSYYAIEQPMVRLRRRFGAHAVADRAEAGETLAPVGV